MAIDVLVGPYRAGKSTLARAVAISQERTALDTDRLLQYASGVDPASLKGEGALEELAALHWRYLPAEIDDLPNDCIVSTGYLLPMFEALTARLLDRDGVRVVYLQPDIDTLEKRWNMDPAEPPVPRTIIEEVARSLHPYYAEIADVVVPITLNDDRHQTALYIGHLLDI